MIKFEIRKIKKFKFKNDKIIKLKKKKNYKLSTSDVIRLLSGSQIWWWEFLSIKHLLIEQLNHLKTFQ